MTNKKRTDAKTATLLKRVIQSVGDNLDPNMTLHQLHIFLTIADSTFRSGEIEQRRLEEDCELSAAAISRNVSYLGPWSSRQKPGLGLVEVTVDLSNRRRHPVQLTKKGRNVMKKLNTAVGGSA